MRTIYRKSIYWFGFAFLVILSLFSNADAQQCNRTIVADVVAIDQSIFFNRLGAFNPIGMIYALRRDVIDIRTGTPEGVRNNRGQVGVLTPGFVQLRPDKRPRPIVLRMNSGDCLQINFTNLLNPTPAVANIGGVEIDDQPVTRQTGIHVNGMQVVGSILSDGSNVGRNSQTHPGPSGLNGLVAPGQSITYRFYAEFENTYLLYNMGSTVGGEGLGGTIAFGLFGAVNVEPRGAEWYRSQVTREEMDLATAGRTASGHPIINYDARYPNREPFITEGKVRRGIGLPILKMLDGNQIVHSDLNAIITGPNRGNFQSGAHYPSTPVNPDQQKPFREFTAIFHDEAFALQAFPEFFENPEFSHTLHGVRDGLGINYGIGGIGPEIVANRLGLGPMWDCNDCKYEEFFLTSWVVADPGMVVDIPANAGPIIDGQRVPGPRATVAFYPDDPSSVHSSYINDHVKIRNLHAGPAEHHMFHLHAHQWVFSPMNDKSSYLDGQGIGPGSGYTYDIAFGGSGNRNKTPGDAIFHCHFYPHFAQGMWALWRNHDVFEEGTRLEVQFNARLRNGGRAPFAIGSAKPAPGSRALPDGEIPAGTPIPAVVPIPGLAMAPMPGRATVQVKPGLPGSQVVITEPDANGDGIPDRNPGFPFFIAGIAGHRPPTPLLDLIDDGGLPRHVVVGPLGANTDTTGTLIRQVTSRIDFSKELLNADAIQIPEEGTPAEKSAMNFHGQKFHNSFRPDGTPAQFRTNGRPPKRGAPYADPCVDDNGDPILQGRAPFYIGQTAQTPRTIQYGAENPRTYKAANIQVDAIFNKLGWHHPQQRLITLWEDVAPTMSGQRPPEPFVMRLNTNDCAEYWHTNLVPSIYELDDYQVRTPTDVIGQHIHLVKFDVTSSDGSANGFNYEDGTFSPDEVRERIDAINEAGGLIPYAGGDRILLTARPHPFFGSGPNGRWLGARTTVQRWFADPVLDNEGRDRTLGIVFTHDHFGPSSHQQTGLYASLIVEPAGSTWRHNETGTLLGNRHDGGPTSWQAVILGGSNHIDGPGFREFLLEWGDFQHAYKANWPGTIDSQSYLYAINPSFRVEAQNATAADPGDILQFPGVCPDGVNFRPCPEAIAADDPGTMVVNYRNEPVGLRIFDPNKLDPLGRPGAQADGLAGDLAFAFSSSPSIHRAIPELNAQMPASVRDSTVIPRPFDGLNTGYAIGPPIPGPQLTFDVGEKDPATPLLRVYDGDNVRIKIQTGATEESHNFTIHGVKWLQEFANSSSGWRNTQHLGIDEQFQINVPVIADRGQIGSSADYLYTVNSSADGIWNGVWGILRAYGRQRSDLYALPNNRLGTRGHVIQNLADFVNDDNFRGTCPVTAPRKQFDITAVRAADVLPNDPVLGVPTLVYNSRQTVIPDIVEGGNIFEGGSGPLHDPTALLYVLTDDLDPVTGRLRSGVPIEPLVLRANAGDCIEVTLRNALPPVIPDLPGWRNLQAVIDKGVTPTEKVTFNSNDIIPSSHAGLHVQLLEYDITRSDGTNVGRNPVQTAPPGGIRRYRWYAGDIRLRRIFGNVSRLEATPVEFGAVGLMPADRIEQGDKGLVGAMVILPQGATWTEDPDTRASATVQTGSETFRDFVVVLQKGFQLRYLNNNPVPMVGGEGRMGEDSEDTGNKGINYRTEPAWFRLGFPPHLPFEDQRVFFTQNLYSNAQLTPSADPETPVFTAAPRTPVRFRFVMPTGAGTRNAVLTLHGHLWEREPYNSNPSIKGPDRIAINPTSQKIGSQEGIGPTGHWDIIPAHGAGGAFGITGDYLYRMMDAFHNFDGMWGIFRVE